MLPQLLPNTLPADRNPAAVYLARLSPGSQRTMRSALERLAYIGSGGRETAATYPWHELRYVHVVAAGQALLKYGLAPSTVNKHLSALRGVLREAFNLGSMKADDYQRAISVPAAKGSRLPAGRALNQKEIRKLFHACYADESVSGIRDAALLSVAYVGALRRSEIAALNVDDLGEDGSVRVRSGKGNKERQVFLANGALSALRAWITIRSQNTPALFTRFSSRGEITCQRISVESIFRAFRRRARQAGIDRFSPHDLRRTAAGDLLDAGVDLVTVQHILGHASPTTTSRYDRRGDAVRARAAAKLKVPFLL